QFYQVSADMRHPYYVCGGLQDNNAWCGPSAVRNNTGPIDADWFTVAGGDGMYTRQDPSDYNIVYGESQDASMSRHDFRSGTQQSIRPRFSTAASKGQEARPGNIVNEAAAGDPPQLRFYWNAPFEISPFNPHRIYMAGQYFFASNDRGDTWTMNAEDLTKNVSRWSASKNIMGVADNLPMVEKNDGLSASSVATQVRESPSQPGEIWVGTDDGNLQLSLDGGQHFTNVMPNLDASVASAPRGAVLVSRIEPSHFSGAVTYVALDNHRHDDFHPYLYKTTDYGKTWSDVTANLPAMGEVQALREDSRNRNLLFVGTEFGLYISLDGASTWQKFMTGMPGVPVRSILIHPRERDLIIGTHGRSIWIADDITPLEQMGNIGDADVHLFDPRPAVEWKNDLENQPHIYQDQFHGQNPQGGTAISIWAKSDMGPATIDFLQDGKVVSTMKEKDIKTGMNRFQWNMRGPAPKPTKEQEAQIRRFRRFLRGGNRGVPFVSAGGGGFFSRFTGQGPLLAPGSYIVRVSVGGQTLQSSVLIKADVWMHHEN
ncbi:MAG: WD40/YVTN/BNR-like repeat-containing protein, partial [Terriglobales bacterium]